MFRKNLASHYKIYARSLRAVKDKISLDKNAEIKQILENSSKPSLKLLNTVKDKLPTSQKTMQQVMLDVQNQLKERFTACSIAVNKKLADCQTDEKQSTYTKIQTRSLKRLEEFKERIKCDSLNYSRYRKKLELFKNLANENLKRCYIMGTVSVAMSSTSSEITPAVEATGTSLVIEPIPEPPPIPDPSTFADTASQLNALGEPTLASLDLGGWTPVGIVQMSLEYLHVAFGIPWWEAIVIGTIIVRFLMFPLVVLAQRNAAKMNNYLPQLQAIQLKMTEARQTGNQLDAARYSQEMMLFMKEKNLNPLKNMIVPLAQMPLFISFFMGLRKMANLPVDSLRTGGMWWFTDLTVPDQYFALPIITSFTLWATIELGTDSARLSSQNLQTMKYVLRALPLVVLPFTINFPGAILCYWVSSNFVSLLQVGFLQIPSVRQFFKIEPLLKHDPQNLPIKSKGFIGGVKDSWANIKITREIEERQRYDAMQFQRAGKGPIIKTYKYDPTTQINNPNAISAKKR